MFSEIPATFCSHEQMHINICQNEWTRKNGERHKRKTEQRVFSTLMFKGATTANIHYGLPGEKRSKSL